MPSCSILPFFIHCMTIGLDSLGAEIAWQEISVSSLYENCINLIINRLPVSANIGGAKIWRKIRNKIEVDKLVSLKSPHFTRNVIPYFTYL